MVIQPGQQIEAPVNLPAPAAAGGVFVALASSDPSIASVAPAAVYIPSGQTAPPEVPRVTGKKPGSATITATAAGFQPATMTVQVVAPPAGSGGLTLPSSLTVRTGQQVTYPVTLASPAAAGGVLVSLSVTDSSVATVVPNVLYIAEGSNRPDEQPQLTGVAVGSVAVSASAAGFPTASGRVQVVPELTLSFEPATLTLTAADGTLNLKLSGPAPVSGLTVNLTSSAPDIATVPATAAFPPFATSLPIPVHFLAFGTAKITAGAAPTIPDTTAVVNRTVPNPSGPLTVVSGTGQTVCIGSPAPNPLVVLVTDANQKPASGVLVSFDGPSSGPGIVSTTAVSDATGVASATVKANGTVGGPYAVTASVPGASVTFSLTNTSCQPLNVVAVSGGGQTAVAGAPFANPLVVSVKDASNNPVGGVTVTFAGPASGAGIITTTAVTNASGVASAIVTANAFAGGPYAVTATAGPGGGATFQLTNNARPVASLTVNSGDGQTAPVNSVFAAPLSVTAKDASNNPIPGVTVTFAGPASGAGIASTVTAVTNASGVATAAVTANGTVGGPYPVTATAGSASVVFSLTNTTTALPTLIVNSGSGQSTAVTSAFANALVVTLKDGSNNPVAGATVTFTGPASGAGLAQSVTAATNASGVAIAQVTANSVAGGPYLVTATAGAATATFSLTNTAGTPGTLTPTSGGGQTGEVNKPFANPLTAVLKDIFGNPIGGETVTFTGPSSGASIATTTAVTNASGVASAVVTANGTGGGPYTVQATASGLSAAFSLTNKDCTGFSGGTTSGSGQTAVVNTPFANPLVVEVKDLCNHPMAGLVVTFTGPASGAGLAATVTATTNASGVATAAVTANGTPGTYNVTATTGAGAATFTLTNTPAPPASVTVNSGGGQSTQILAAFANPLSVTVKDAGNNPLGGVTVTFAGPASGAGIVTATATTNASGVATATVTANATAGGPYAVTATAGTATATFQLTNVTGPPASVTFNSGGGQSTQVKTAFANPISVTVKDAGNNLLSGVTVTFTGPASGAGIVTTTATTNASGVATATVTANATAGGPYTLTATAGSVSAALQLTNTPGPAASMTASSGSGQTASINTAFANPLSVTVKDADNNLVSGATVTFTGPASGAGINPATATATTNASGVAAATVTANGTVGGPYSVTASAGPASASFSLTNAAFLPPTMTVNAGSGQNTVVGTAFAIPLSVTLKDSSNNPVAGTTVTFAGPASGTGIAAPVTATTNASGVASATVVANNVAGGPYTVTATAGSASATFSLTNKAGAPSAMTVNSGSGQTASVGTAFANPLSVTLKDSFGNPVPSVTVTFSGPASGAGILAATALTDAAGVAAAVVTANGTAGGPYAVQASAAGVSATFTLTNTTCIAMVSGSGQSTNVNSAFPNPLVVKLTGGGGSPLSGVTVTYSGPGIVTNTAVTDASGVASAFVSANSTVGSHVVTATGGCGSVTFALFTLSGGAANIPPVTVGQNLQVPAAFTLAAPAGPGGTSVQVAVSDPTKLQVAAGPTDPGARFVTLNIPQGSNTGGVWVHGLASSGTGSISVTAGGVFVGIASVTLTPSAILMSGPFGSTTAFTTNVGAAPTTLTLTPVRLDASLNFAETQRLRGGFADPADSQSGTYAASVVISNSSPNVGTVGTPAKIPGGSSSATTLFAPGPGTGTTTLTAVPPAGFSTPSSGNVVTATANAAAIVCDTVTVGNNLQSIVTCRLVGGSPAGLRSVVLTSDDTSKILLAPLPTAATTCTATGVASITVTTVGLPGGGAAIPAFCVYGLGSSGTASFSINGSSMGYGPAKGNVGLAPSGFVIAGPGGIGSPDFYTLFTGSSPVPINVYSAQLDANGVYVATQALAAGVAPVTVNVTSGTPSVGTITASPVSLIAGTQVATTNFQPLSSGSSLLSLSVPAGYSTPASQYRTVTANVPGGGSGLQVDSPSVVGQSLQDSGTVRLSPTPASNTVVTITSLDPKQLLVSASATVAGTASTTITIPAGTTTGAFYLQALDAPIIAGLTLHNNTPAAGSIAWDAFTIKYQGTSYAIAAGNTSSQFAVWTPGTNTAAGAASVSAAAFLVAYNVNGTGGTVSGGVNYTVTTATQGTVTASTVIAPSGVTFSSTFLFTTVGSPASPVSLSTAALNPADNSYSTSQALRAGAAPLQVALLNSNSAVGNVSSPVTIAPGTSSGTAQFTPVASGVTTISVITPAGFVGSSNKISLGAIVQ